MTIFLIILGSLLFLIFLIMLLQVNVVIEAKSAVLFYLKILFIRIPLFPSKSKQPRLKDYSPNKIKKRAEKKKRKEEAKQYKNLKKKQKKESKQHSQETKSTKKHLSPADVLEIIDLIRELSKTFFARFGKRLKLKLTRIHITVGGEDAASTALTYGAIAGGVSCLCGFLDSILTVKPKAEKDINVSADFTSESISVDISITASLRVWHALDILLSVAISFVKQKFLKN